MKRKVPVHQPSRLYPEYSGVKPRPHDGKLAETIRLVNAACTKKLIEWGEFSEGWTIASAITASHRSARH